MRSSKIEYLPESFGELDGLRKLDLSTTQLKTFPNQIIPLKGISQVILTGSRVGDLPVDIAKMRSGVIFYLYGVPNLTYDHMTYINSIATGITFYTSFGFF